MKEEEKTKNKADGKPHRLGGIWGWLDLPIPNFDEEKEEINEIKY